MKNCQACNNASQDDAPACVHCGECAWSPMATVPKRPAVHQQDVAIEQAEALTDETLDALTAPAPKGKRK